MDERELRDYQIRINHTAKAIDELYREASVRSNMSCSALWIFYTLRITGMPMTQSELCDAVSLAKQTVNSSLKKLEEEGYIELRNDPGNRKNKLIYMTQRGIALAEHVSDPVISAETNVLRRMPDKKRAEFLETYSEYCRALKDEFEKM